MSLSLDAKSEPAASIRLAPWTAVASCLLLAACSQAVTERNATLAQRVCGVTLADPAGWIRSLEASARRDPKLPVDLTEREIAAQDCVRGNVYDLAASGLEEGSVVRAARSECDRLETDYLALGYGEYHASIKPEDQAQAQPEEQWQGEKRTELGEVAHNAFVEARAGQCWAHRAWQKVRYEPGIP